MWIEIQTRKGKRNLINTNNICSVEYDGAKMQITLINGEIEIGIVDSENWYEELRKMLGGVGE